MIRRGACLTPQGWRACALVSMLLCPWCGRTRTCLAYSNGLSLTHGLPQRGPLAEVRTYTSIHG